ncbi:MAG: lactonase family protein [Thermoguttaceae bacterium]|nr:lactonase family protein [Thermoguttaceae bacterium]
MNKKIERTTARLLSACAVLLALVSTASAADYWIYFGTSTEKTTEEMDRAGTPRSEGIYVGKFDSETGAISDVRLALKAAASGYIATLPDKDLLYFVGCADPKDGGANAYACKVDPKTGDLTLINGAPTTGRGVCHTSVSADGKFLNAANYVSGDFSVLKLNPDGSVDKTTAKYFRDGSGPLKRRQDHPYGHSSYFVDSGAVRRVFMSDLGSDRIYIAILNQETGELTEDPNIPYLATPAGAGPRHLAFANDAAGKLVVFSINELDSTLSAFRVDFEAGKSESLGTWSTIEDEYRKGLTDEETLVDGQTYSYGNKTAAIEAVKIPSGKTLVYATNRGQNTIVAFDASSIIAGASTKDGGSVEFPLLQRVSTRGAFPRYMTLDPTHKFLIVSNKKSGTIYVYSIDSKTGELTVVNDEPTRVAWVIAGGFIPIKE